MTNIGDVKTTVLGFVSHWQLELAVILVEVRTLNAGLDSRKIINGILTFVFFKGVGIQRNVHSGDEKRKKHN